MQDDFYPAAEKILFDIFQILKKDSELRTVEIIPTITNTNKSPVYHEEHCLGLESWCIQPVYCHAYQCVMKIRQNKERSRDLKRLNVLLVGVLLINPDITSFWNMRKEMINCGKLDPSFELHFSAVILSRKPKSSDVYAHRKWVLCKLMKDFNDRGQLLASELVVCEAAADRYSNNYHAWTHRLWCINQGTHIHTNHVLHFFQELSWSQSWILRHISDYSGLHYRQQILSMLCAVLPILRTETLISYFSHLETALDKFPSVKHNCQNERISLVLKLIIVELVFNTEMINDFIAHEALWCHRRFILHLYRCHSPSVSDVMHSNSDGIPSEKSQKVEELRINLHTELCLYENAFLGQCKLNHTDSTSIKYATRHRQWLSLNIMCDSIFSQLS